MADRQRRRPYAAVRTQRAYEQVWIEEIAERAGISRGLLYHYFPTKRDFFGEVVRSLIREAYEQTEPDLELEPFERLRASTRAFVSHVEARADAFRALFAAGFATDPDIREALASEQESQVERILAGLEPDAGRSNVLQLAVRGWFGFNIRAALEWLDSEDVSSDQLADLMAHALVGLVGAAAQVDPSVGPVS